MADNYDSIPAELKKLERWVVSTAEDDTDTPETVKAKKCPINALTGGKASPTNPGTWSTFGEATQAIATQIPTHYGKAGECGVAGHLGFMLGDGYAGIDLDHVVTGGVIVPWAAQVVADVGSYAEYSPSGTGVHIIVKGCKVPKGVSHRKAVTTNEDDTSQEMEAYDKGRYFRVTGDVVPKLSPSTICDNQEAFTAVCERHLSKGQQGKGQPATQTPTRHTEKPATVATVLEKMFGSKTGSKWERLYYGDMEGYDSHSSADYALCFSLAYWCGCDSSLIDECFRGSNLMRDKWDERRGEETYGEMTVRSAIEMCSADYPEITHHHPESQVPTEDAEGFVVPPPYVFRDGYLYLRQGEDKPERLIMRSRLEVVGRLSMQDSTMRYTVRVGGSGGRTLDVDAKAVKCKRDAVERFGGAGYDVNDANSTDVIKWFSAQIAANGKSITTTKGVSHAGWCGARGFAPYLMDEYMFTPTAGYEDMAKALTEPRGTLDGWREVVRVQREGNDVFRFMLAASFTAPLVSLVGFQSRFVYVEGKSRHGKSAAMKACASVWGNPDTLVNQYRDTLNGILSNASFLHNLPLLVDELQSANAKNPAGKRQCAESLAYAFGQGHDKTRLDRGANRKGVGSWSTLAISDGEQGVIGNSTGTGAGNRTAELVGVPFDGEPRDIELVASAMHTAIATQYGTAGREFIGYLLATYGDDVTGGVRSGYGTILTTVRGEYPTHPHADLVALVTFADTLETAAVFKEQGPEVLERSLGMARHVLPLIKGAEELDVGRRSAQFVLDWMSTNEDNFDGTAHVRYGYHDSGDNPDVWKVIPTNLNKALDDNGFDHEQALRGLVEVGVIERGDSSHLAKMTRQGGRRLRCYQIDKDKLTDYLG